MLRSMGFGHISKGDFLCKEYFFKFDQTTTCQMKTSMYHHMSNEKSSAMVLSDFGELTKLHTLVYYLSNTVSRKSLWSMEKIGLDIKYICCIFVWTAQT